MKLRQLILVVEPSDRLAQLIRGGLKAKGFDVTMAKRGSDAVRAATALSSDVIIANATLPDMEGAELRRAILQCEDVADLPLVIYQPKVSSHARHRFVIEPDLYASEPVSLPRFCQRVATLSRPRGARAIPEVCESGTLKVDTVAHRVFVNSVESPLTALEFRLLVTFMACKDRVLSREQLLRDVWGIRAHADTRTVDTNVKRLRQKLGPVASVIETIRNVGYRFVGAEGAGYAGSANSPRPSMRSTSSGERPADEAS